MAPGQSSARPLRVIPGGASNSRPTVRTDRDDLGRAGGYDTVRYRFRDLPETAYARARDGGAHQFAGGELRRTAGAVTVGVYPDGRGYVEGRVAAIVNGPDDHRLLGPAALEIAAARAGALGGFEGAGVVAIGRADVAAELLYDDPAEGRAVLAAAAAVDVPWWKTGTEGVRRGVPETVAWRSVNGRQIGARLYDKGVETGQAPAGMWLRWERQRRWRKSREMTPAAIARTPLETLFLGREMRALLNEATDDVILCDRQGAIAAVRDHHRDGRITWRTAEQLVGFLALNYERELVSPSTWRRRMARLRSLNINLSVAAAHDERRVVPLRGEFRRFVGQLAA